ncbi:MAG: VWA domain-containing protein [Chloroflexi bacterium]|nr:VWA domain-containing protein [Chloroflexota bacterium]MDA1271630.1 VWA domain-containing protein [Chloroflexota bacterium]
MPGPIPIIPNDAGPDGHILHSLTLFAEMLRRVGLEVGSGNMLDLVKATEHVSIGKRGEFFQAARSILVHRKQDLPIFDEAFQVFWRKPSDRTTTMDLRSLGEQKRFKKPQVSTGRDDEPGNAGTVQGEPDDDSVQNVDLSRTYSAVEVFRQKDFSEFTSREMADARLMMSGLSWDLGQRRTRRLTAGRSGPLDLRRTMRNSLRNGGEFLDLSHRSPKDKPRSLVLICDVSGSMERYTRILLQFIHTIAGGSLMGGVEQLEAFLFATRLTRITRSLKYRSIDQAVDEVSKSVPDWAGGTRIGDAVKTFNYTWLRRVLRGQAVVLIISDGWDRGDPELLARETSRLQRSCHRLIWLNPLLGSPDYQPLTQGMKAALPFVDDFLPVHNLNSLQSLAQHLNSLAPDRTLGPAYHTPAKEQEPEPEPGAAAAPDRPIDRLKLPTFQHPQWGKRP